MTICVAEIRNLTLLDPYESSLQRWSLCLPENGLNRGKPKMTDGLPNYSKDVDCENKELISRALIDSYMRKHMVFRGLNIFIFGFNEISKYHESTGKKLVKNHVQIDLTWPKTENFKSLDPTPWYVEDYTSFKPRFSSQIVLDSPTFTNINCA